MAQPPAAADPAIALALRLRDAGDRSAALTVLHRLLAADPADQLARFHLATLLIDGGDTDAARAQLTPLAAAAPGAPGTLWLRARVAIAERRTDEAAGALTALLAHGAIDEGQRAEALLQLGLVREELGDVDGAFAAATAGKALQRRLHAPQAASSEGEAARLARIAAWLAAQPPGRPSRTANVPGAARTHVFLLGFPRSGTTLLEQVLATHHEVRTLEEEPLLATAYQAFLSSPAACDRLARLDDAEADAWAGDYWRRVRGGGIEPDTSVFVDKQPAGTIDLPVIARLFPDARILFALRDPRDVVLSCFRQPFRLNAATYAFTDLAAAAASYDATMLLAGIARARLPLAWRDARHEALVDDYAGEVAAILGFLGLGGDAGMADFVATANARAIRTPSAAQVRAGLNRRGLGRWRRFERHLAPILPLLAPWVERLGYAP